MVAPASPVSDAIRIGRVLVLFFASDWVEETNALNEATVACGKTVGDNSFGGNGRF